MSLQTAKRCFQENCQLINPSSDPVAWNLNNGLANLADALQQMENRLSQIEQSIRHRS
jgi:hypothetical protein